ncbi:MAG: hypothetical protein ACRBCI_10290 [Cellvibrionaceae bacterium]
MPYLISVVLIVIISPFASASDKAENIYSPNQTSASLLVRYGHQQIDKASAENKQEAERKYTLLFDIYIKARSYYILNKVFFWLSIITGISVLLWPSASIVFKNKLDKWEWLKSATVQTTITGIAALMFTFYSQYKDKQAYAEALMRHVAYSDQKVSTLSVNVAEELAKIDRGFSFTLSIDKTSINNKPENKP